MGKNKKVKSAKPTAPEPSGPVPEESRPSPRTASSSFYPAIPAPAPCPPPQGAQEASEPLPAPPPPKAHKKAKVAASWAAKAAAVLVPAILSGFSSYQSSKTDQEGGYKATVTAVEELQGAVEELVKQVAYMQGELDATRGETARLHGTKAMKRRPKPELKTVVTLSKLPPDLGAAVKSKGRPMEQNSYSMAPMDADGIFDVDEKAVLDEAAKKRALALDEMLKKRAAMAKKKEVMPIVVEPAPPILKVEEPPAPAAPVE